MKIPLEVQLLRVSEKMAFPIEVCYEAEGSWCAKEIIKRKVAKYYLYLVNKHGKSNFHKYFNNGGLSLKRYVLKKCRY